MNIAAGIVIKNKGPSKPMYGISTPPPISIAGILMGGAAMPIMAAMQIMAPVFSFGIPISKRTGATKAPALSTAAVEEPVIIPGNITTRPRSINIRAGSL